MIRGKALLGIPAKTPILLAAETFSIIDLTTVCEQRKLRSAACPRSRGFIILTVLAPLQELLSSTQVELEILVREAFESIILLESIVDGAIASFVLVFIDTSRLRARLVGRNSGSTSLGLGRSVGRQIELDSRLPKLSGEEALVGKGVEVLSGNRNGTSAGRAATVPADGSA